MLDIHISEKTGGTADVRLSQEYEKEVKNRTTHSPLTGSFNMPIKRSLMGDKSQSFGITPIAQYKAVVIKQKNLNLNINKFKQCLPKIVLSPKVAEQGGLLSPVDTRVLIQKYPFTTSNKNDKHMLANDSSEEGPLIILNNTFSGTIVSSPRPSRQDNRVKKHEKKVQYIQNMQIEK